VSNEHSKSALVAIIVGATLSLPIVCWRRVQSVPSQASPQPELKAAPPTPIAIQKADLGDPQPWKPQWDRLIEESLPDEFLSNKRAPQVRPLCPRFQRLSEADRRAFWAYFFQALAGAEAGLKPTADVRHDDPEVAIVDPVTKRVARQQGLLQLAYMDSQRYGCEFNWENDKQLSEHDPAKTILQPRNNLLCGIKILDYQLITQRKPLLSPSSYWVTLRPGTYSFQNFLEQMSNEPVVCGASPAGRLRSEERSSAAAAGSNPRPTSQSDPVGARVPRYAFAGSSPQTER
jgi:hypothetical protein